MPVIMQNAAAMAYQKAVKKTREALIEQPDTPEWLRHFGANLVEDDSKSKPKVLIETKRHRKMRILAESNNIYLKLAWIVYDKITSKLWFEFFVLINIVLVGIVTGLDLEFDQDDNNNQDIKVLSLYVSKITLGVFTIECMLKIISEGYEPWIYFIDRKDGYFNTFDFIVVVSSYSLLNDENGQTISFLRMLRLLRLLTFVKDVPQLRIIVAGLTQGMKSVVYIVMLLFLIIYMYSILGCILFGENDPAHFGTVSIAMTSLFQVSTLASWTSIAYVSWFGCDKFLESPYHQQNPSRIDTLTGTFEGFKCTVNDPEPFLTGLFFSSYILLTSWVIMSLFVGVISMGMFESFLKFKQKDEFTTYLNKLDENSMSETECFELGKISLKEKMDKVLEDDIASKYRPAKWKRRYHKLVSVMIKIRDSNQFSLLITIIILLVGVVIGFETDRTLKCNRLELRMKDNDDNEKSGMLNKCSQEEEYSIAVAIVAQIVFTFEMIVKVFSEGSHPSRYFTHRENGSWNCLDFFIVVVGFMELSALKSAFENFPVVLLRLLRLVRVMRLAKALPRLRSIVEALISGFSSVGWICLLIFVFNYIIACMFMLIFRNNDPFHFSSVGAAMFTVLRIETLDTWDQILYIAMYGCEGYPNGYEFLKPSRSDDEISCESSKAFGWIGAIILLFVTIVGAYVLPTVLIGVVSIKFDDTNSYFISVEQNKVDFQRKLTNAKEKMPEYFTEERVAAIVDVFHTLNAGGDTALDMPEISIFFHYSFEHLFGIQLTRENCESLFYLLDSSKSTTITLGEFVSFILILRQMHEATIKDQNISYKIFGKKAPVKKRRSIYGEKTTWDKAMDRVHQESYEMTWDAILVSINGEEGDTLKERIIKIFKDFDSDGSGELDIDEMGEGLKSCGVPLNKPQVKYFFSQIKTHNEGMIRIHEFIHHVELEVQRRLQLKDDELLQDMKSVLARTNKLFKPESNFLTEHCSIRSFTEHDKSSRDLRHKFKILEEHEKDVCAALEQLRNALVDVSSSEEEEDDEGAKKGNLYDMKSPTPRARHNMLLAESSFNESLFDTFVQDEDGIFETSSLKRIGGGDGVRINNEVSGNDEKSDDPNGLDIDKEFYKTFVRRFDPHTPPPSSSSNRRKIRIEEGQKGTQLDSRPPPPPARLHPNENNGPYLQVKSSSFENSPHTLQLDRNRRYEPNNSPSSIPNSPNSPMLNVPFLKPKKPKQFEGDATTVDPMTFVSHTLRADYITPDPGRNHGLFPGADVNPRLREIELQHQQMSNGTPSSSIKESDKNDDGFLFFQFF